MGMTLDPFKHPQKQTLSPCILIGAGHWWMYNEETPDEYAAICSYPTSDRALFDRFGHTYFEADVPELLEALVDF